MKRDPKDTAALVIGMAKPSGEEMSAGEPDGDEGGDMDGESVAAGEVMSALKTGDTEAFKEALKSFIDICSYSKEM